MILTSILTGEGKGDFRTAYIGFTDRLKREIKKRDDYRCQKCGRKEIVDTDGQFLVVHHISGYKWESWDTNLITLCLQCHNEMTQSRYYWMLYYQAVIKKIYNGTWKSPVYKKQVVIDDRQMKIKY